MDYTLITYFEGKIHEAFDIHVPGGLDAIRLGLINFTHVSNDLDIRDSDDECGPLGKNNTFDDDICKELDHYLNREEPQLLADHAWLRWYIERCYHSEDQEHYENNEDFPEDALEHGWDIVACYFWDCEYLGNHRSEVINDGDMVGILVKGDVDVD